MKQVRLQNIPGLRQAVQLEIGDRCETRSANKGGELDELGADTAVVEVYEPVQVAQGVPDQVLDVDVGVDGVDNPWRDEAADLLKVRRLDLRGLGPLKQPGEPLRH